MLKIPENQYYKLQQWRYMQTLDVGIILSHLKMIIMSTRNYLHSFLFLIALISVTIAGCSKKDDDGPGNNGNKNVKYEISGNFTGKFTAIISDHASGTQTISDVAVPWSKEVSYGSNVIAVGFGAGMTAYGSAGQTAVLKIYVNGNVVKQSNATAGSYGEITLPALAHNF
jgi:hypothetical protein